MSPTSSNPWLGLPAEPPFVLAEDRAVLAAFNAKVNPRTRVETALLPEPYVGRVEAPVFLLLLNPGVSNDDFAFHRQPAFRERVRRCHRHEAAP